MNFLPLTAPTPILQQPKSTITLNPLIKEYEITNQDDIEIKIPKLIETNFFNRVAENINAFFLDLYKINNINDFIKILQINDRYFYVGILILIVAIYMSYII